MKPLVQFLVGLFLTICTTSCLANDLCPLTNGTVEWSNNCFIVGESGDRRVRQKFLKKIKIDERGVAEILIARPPELLLIDAIGRVKIPGIRFTGDFDYPNPREGLGRYDSYIKDKRGFRVKRCGYFDARTLEVVVPAAFVHCDHFEQGLATVCLNCTKYCTEPECQHSILLDGQGLQVNRNGRILRRFALPALSDMCRGRGKVRTEKISQHSTYVSCVAEKEKDVR